MSILVPLLTAVVGFLLGGIAVFAWMHASARGTDPGTVARLQAHGQALEQQLRLVTESSGARISEYQHLLKQTQTEFQQERQGFEARLAHMSAVRERELQAGAERALQQESEQGQVLAALAPVADSLQNLQRRLTALEEQRHQQFGTLSQQLRSAQETEQQLHQATVALESALRNTSVRGSWGEIQLRNIVEAAGLTNQVDFVTQATIGTGESSLRPDMIIHLPGGKALPVDAKVPFESFIRATEVPAGGSAEQQALRKQLLDRHVKAVRGHVDALATKDYGRWVSGSPDFTVAFIPSESLLSAALEADPSLLDYAFRKRVALASPVTLWSVLKTVSYSWQQDNLSREAQEVFTLARELYSRLSTLGGHTRALGQSLSKAVDSYNAFIGSLERRVLVSARRLQALDKDTVIESLAPVAVSPRPAVEAELLGSSSAPDGEAADVLTT